MSRYYNVILQYADILMNYTMYHYIHSDDEIKQKHITCSWICTGKDKLKSCGLGAEANTSMEWKDGWKNYIPSDLKSEEYTI